MRFRPILLGLASLVIAGSCGGDSISYPLVPIESTTFASSLGVNLAASTKTPSGLYYRDIRIGTGATLVNGTKVTAKYTGALANGTVFDAGTYPFTLGASQVIQGWDIGLVGMKVGGSRQLIIPSELGYGTRGAGTDIPPNAVLVFTVEPQ